MRTLVSLPALLLAACAGGDPKTTDSGDTGAAADGLACSADAVQVSSVQLPEVRLDVRCQGPADGPTVLLLHGFPEYSGAWEPVMGLLAAQGYRAVAPDQRGYNTSDKPEDIEDYALDHLVADVDALIDVLGGPVVLVGHDWGGGAAWAVASDHPEQLSGLLIMNAPHMNTFKRELAENPEQQEAFSYLDLFVSAGTEDLLVANDFAILSGMFEGVLTEDELAAYKEAWGQPRAIEGGLNWYRANFADGLPNIDRELTVSVPTTVMWGMDDTALLPSNMDGLDQYVADLKLVEVPGASHWINHEEPAAIAQEITDLVEGAPR